MAVGHLSLDSVSVCNVGNSLGVWIGVWVRGCWCIA